MKKYYGRLTALVLIGLMSLISACRHHIQENVIDLSHAGSPRVRLWADHPVRIHPGWVNFKAFLEGELSMPHDQKANNWKCLVPSWDYGDYNGAKPSTNTEITCADDMDADPRRLWEGYHRFDFPGVYNIRFFLVSRTGKRVVSPGYMQIEVKG